MISWTTATSGKFPGRPYKHGSHPFSWKKLKWLTSNLRKLKGIMLIGEPVFLPLLPLSIEGETLLSQCATLSAGNDAEIF